MQEGEVFQAMRKSSQGERLTVTEKAAVREMRQAMGQKMAQIGKQHGLHVRLMSHREAEASLENYKSTGKFQAPAPAKPSRTAGLGSAGRALQAEGRNQARMESRSRERAMDRYADEVFRGAEERVLGPVREAGRKMQAEGMIEARRAQRRRDAEEAAATAGTDDIQAMREGVPRETSDVSRLPDPKDIPGNRPGQPPSLRLRPDLQQEPTPGTEPIRVRDIRTSMEGFATDPIQGPMRHKTAAPGVGRTKGILGWYRDSENMIRLKGMGDVVVMAHEWAHRMQGKMLGMDWLPPNREIEAQLMKAAETYPGLKRLPRRARVAEGWAEFWARWTLQDPVLQKQVPDLYDWAMNWLGQPSNARLRGQMQRIQGDIQRWIEQGAIGRVRQSRVSVTDKPSEYDKRARGTLWERAVDVVNRTMFDYKAGFKSAFSRAIRSKLSPKIDSPRELQRAVAEYEREIPITMNPSRVWDVLEMKATREAATFLNEFTYNLKGEKTGRSAKSIFEQIGEENYEDFVTYLHAKRSIEDAQRGREVGPASLRDFVAVAKQLETPEFKSAARSLREWQHRLIDYVAESGALLPKEAKALKDSYEFYVPLQRVLEGPKAEGGRGVAERGTGFRAQKKGDQREIMDPIEAMIEQTRNVIAKAHQARVMKAMYVSNKLMDGMGPFVTEVARDIEAKGYTVEQVVNAIEKMAERTTNWDTEVSIKSAAKTIQDLFAIDPELVGTMLTMFSQKVKPTGSRPIIAYMPKFSEAELKQIASQYGSRKAAEVAQDIGKIKWLEVDTDAYEALMGIDAPKSVLDALPTAVRRFMEIPGTVLRTGATLLSPSFVVRNMARDAMTQPLYTKEGEARPYTGIVDMVKGASSVIRKTPEAELFEALGGQMSTFFGAEMGAGRASLEMAGQVRGPVAAVRHLFGKLVDVMGAPEQFLRIREFEKTMERAEAEGKSREQVLMESMESANEITINFARAGTMGRALNRIIPYFNAGLQGNRKFIRTLAGKEGAAAQKRALVNGLATLTSVSVIQHLLHGDEEWFQELPGWRRANYWNFKDPFSGEIISVPKPFEAGKVFTLPFEMAADNALDENPVAAKDALWDVASGFFNGFAVVPAFVGPTVEVVTNYDFFTQREVVPNWMKRTRLPEDQYTSYTTGLAKAFGQSLGVSPAKIEHWIDGHTGGLGLYLMRLADDIGSVMGGSTKEANLEDLPGCWHLLQAAGVRAEPDRPNGVRSR